MTHKTAALQQTVGLFDSEPMLDDGELWDLFQDPTFQLLDPSIFFINEPGKDIFENPLGKGNEEMSAISEPYVQSPIPPSTTQDSTRQKRSLRAAKIVNYAQLDHLSTSENEEDLESDTVKRTVQRKIKKHKTSHHDEDIIISTLPFTQNEDTWIKNAGDAKKTKETWQTIADEYNLVFPEDPRKPKQLRERYENHLNDAYSHSTIPNEAILKILPEINAAIHSRESINWSHLAKTISLEDGKHPTPNALKNKYNTMYRERRR